MTIKVTVIDAPPTLVGSTEHLSAVYVEMARDSLAIFDELPSDNAALDNKCRRIALSALVKNVVANDRAHRQRKGYPDAR